MKNVNSLSSLSDNSLSSRRATGTIRELDLESRMTFNYKLPKKNMENKINDYVVDIQEYKNQQRRQLNHANKNLNCFERNNTNNDSNDNLSMSNDLFYNESNRVNSLNAVTDLKKNLINSNRKLSLIATKNQITNDLKYSIDANLNKLNSNREQVNYYKNASGDLNNKCPKNDNGLNVDSNANMCKNITDKKLELLGNSPRRKLTNPKLTFSDLDKNANLVSTVNLNERFNLNKAITDNGLKIPDFNKFIKNDQEINLDLNKKDVEIRNENLLQIPNFILPNSHHSYDETENLIGIFILN